MKNIIRILGFFAFTFILTSCFDDPGNEILFDNSNSFVEISDVSVAGADRKVYSVVLDGNYTDDNITIAYSGNITTSDVTVNVEVVTAESSAVEGVDFSLASTSVTIPAGSFSAALAFAVNDDILDPEADAKTLTLRITQTSQGEINPNFEVITLNLIGICPPDTYDYETIPGTYSVLSSGASTDSCPANATLSDFAGSLTLTYVSGSVADGSFVYSVNDSFAGMYIEWYGDCYGYTFATTNEITLDVATGNISGAWSSAFTNDSFGMTGTFDFCNGDMVLDWTNSFGDTGTTTVSTM